MFRPYCALGALLFLLASPAYADGDNTGSSPENMRVATHPDDQSMNPTERNLLNIPKPDPRFGNNPALNNLVAPKENLAPSIAQQDEQTIESDFEKTDAQKAQDADKKRQRGTGNLIRQQNASKAASPTLRAKGEATPHQRIRDKATASGPTLSPPQTASNTAQPLPASAPPPSQPAANANAIAHSINAGDEPIHAKAAAALSATQNGGFALAPPLKEPTPPRPGAAALRRNQSAPPATKPVAQPTVAPAPAASLTPPPTLAAPAPATANAAAAAPAEQAETADTDAGADPELEKAQYLINDALNELTQESEDDSETILPPTEAIPPKPRDDNTDRDKRQKNRKLAIKKAGKGRDAKPGRGNPQDDTYDDDDGEPKPEKQTEEQRGVEDLFNQLNR